MIIEVLTAFVASHVGGMAIGGILGRNELFGFGVRAIRAAAQKRAERRNERAKEDLNAWLEENSK